MSSINLVPPSWVGPVMTQAQLKAAIANNDEFQTADIAQGYGQTTTPNELKAMGITHAQIRYGKRLEKVVYVKL
jgi:hypothetical protein